MTDLILAFSRNRPSRLRLPEWQRLVVTLSAMGAAVILLATYSLVTARETGRLAAAAAADAALLARALGEDVAAAEPLVRMVASEPAVRAILAAQETLDQPGRIAEARVDRIAAATGVTIRIYGTDLEPVYDTGAEAGAGAGAAASEGELGEGGATERSSGHRAVRDGMLREAAARGFARAALPVLAPGEGAGDAPRDAPPPAGPALAFAASVTGAIGPQPSGVVLIEALPAALPGVAARAVGPVLIADGEGRVLYSSMLGWSGGVMAEERLFLAGTRYLRESAAVGATGLTVHVLAPLSVVQSQVSEIISIEIMIMSLLVAFVLYMNSVRAARVVTELSQESEALRELNARLRDEIAERRRVEAELRAAEAGLAQASKLAALGQMSAAVSHELNQPLAAMRTYLAGARLLFERERSEEGQASLGRIDGLIDRMSAITRQLKAFARKEGDELHTIDLRDAVRGALAVIAPQLEEAGVTLSTEIAERPVPVKGDQIRLEQILLNLLRNALDAVSERKERRITLALRVRGARAEAVVADTGGGVPAAAVGRLFEPFFTTKQPGKGLGLGLAISAGIAADLSGEITADNRPGGGAQFTLGLPLAGEGAR
ncbi:MAG: ATP-binding protein [Pseudomonadota bacterium]